MPTVPMEIDHYYGNWDRNMTLSPNCMGCCTFFARMGCSVGVFCEIQRKAR